MASTVCLADIVVVAMVTGVIVSFQVDGTLGSMTSVHFGPDPGKVESYCESDMFQIDCRPNEVIVVTHARYGRMRENRCISNAYGEIGCSIDVIDRLDVTCSGRRHCDVIVASLAKEKHQACPKDFRSYLEMSYKCVTVAFADETMCKRRPGPIELRQQSTVGFLSNLVAEETGCGSFDSPWWLMVSPSRGQRLQLTMYEFAPGSAAISMASGGGRPVSRPDGSPVCRVYAVIKETGESDAVRGPGISSTICRDATNRRGRIVYTSSGSGLVEIRLANATIAAAGGVGSGVRQTVTSGVGLPKFNDTIAESRAEYFIIAYEVIGCPELKAPQNGWIRRSGSNVTMGCDTPGGDIWRMKCDGVVWLGDDMRNCTTKVADELFDTNWMSQFAHSKVSSLALVIGIATIVGVTIMIIGMFYLYSRKQQRHPTCDDNDKTGQQSGVLNVRRGNMFPEYGPDANNAALSRKLLTVNNLVDDPHNHYAIGTSRSADSGVAGPSRDGVHGNDIYEDGTSAGAGRHIVLTSSGVSGNDYFHTLDCSSRSGPPGPRYGQRHFMAPYQQQFKYEPTCVPPSYMTSSLLRPTQLLFDDDSAVGLESASMITEHIYESPKLDVHADNIPVTSLTADQYPAMMTVYGAVVEQSNKTGR